MKIKNDLPVKVCFRMELVNIRKTKGRKIFDYRFDIKYKRKIILKDQILSARSLDHLKIVAHSLLHVLLERFLPR